MNKQVKMVYLDSDGVLANFNQEMIRVFGTPFNRTGVDSQERWNLISTHCPNIYRNLESMVDATELVTGVFKICGKYGYTPAILTAIPKFGRLPTAVDDKRAWFADRWPALLNHFYIGPHAVNKQDFSKPGCILIDDSHLNIPQWIARGGFGILHKSASDSLNQLKQYMEEQHGTNVHI